MKFTYKIFLFLAATVAFVACEDFIEGDNINEDPNNPAQVPITAQTPSIQITLADAYGGSFSRFNSMLIQQVEGVARQWTSFNQYTGLTPNRFNAAWENIYESVLNETKIARAEAQETGSTHYEAIMQITEAFALMAATDVWDDMPYSDGLQGIANINPAYDTQAEIYSVINGFLDEAIATLNGPASGTLPGAEDVYYGGDIDLWIKAANAIKARALLHYDDYAGAAAAAAASFDGAEDNLAFQYPDANAAAQWYRFNRDREGDIEFHPTMRTLLTGLNDTMRLKQIDQPFLTTHPYLVSNFVQELITFREMQFIIAEADVRANAGGTAEGHAAYLAGIKASFERFGVAGYEDYVAQSDVDPGMGNLTLEHVMTQKYIAMFLQPEAYSDWRRTEIPALAPVSGSAIPVRWDYAETEYLFNSNSPEQGSISIFTDKVGWNR
ncbi:MAG: SusD/RagB family nutrient-binding outer membrane lipoprotein [Bacteroidota bacterium]